MTILIVMGVSGSGKSTVAQALNTHLHWPYQEGDDLHPPSNVQKMRAGIPLTDEDRARSPLSAPGSIPASPPANPALLPAPP
jgi:carbohydrate kinase (thermoresistant glucokinase family)